MSANSRVSAQPVEPAPSPELPADEPAAPEEQPIVEGAAPVEGATASEEGVAVEEGAAITEGEAPVESEAPAPASGDDIVVTGSRIKSSFGASAAPVEAIGRKQLEQSGVSNLSDLITNLSSTQGSGPQGSVGIGAAGGAASALNLRGLGAGSTLILLNGRRLNPSAASTAGLSDLNAVPLTAVERIEILKAGAAAIYGADAVAGVVNIITRRNFNGLRLEADGQTTSRRDHGEYTLSGSFGAMGERSRVLAAVSYFRRSELTMGERFVEPDKYFSNTGNSLATYQAKMPGALQMPDPACLTSPLLRDITTRNPMTGAVVSLGQGCGFSSLPYLGLFPNVERINAFANGQFDLSDHVMVFGELTVSRYRADNIIVPSFNVTRPFLTVPANHIDNPFKQDVFYDGRPLGVEFPAGVSPASEDGLRGVVGLRGDFGGIAEGSLFENWQWELYASMGISRFRQSNDDNLKGRLQDALNSCSNPADLSRCFNPFYSAIDGTGTPNSQKVIRSFRGRQVILTDHALQTYNAGVSGPLFELPGGDVGVAFGGEIRHEYRATEYDHDANELAYGFLAGNENATATRDVYSGYLELRWPVLMGVELQTAIRLERYTDTETTPSPFAGISIVPATLMGTTSAPAALRTLQLHFNASRAFRAPSILETYPGVFTVPTPINNPMTMTTSYFPVASSGNVDLKPQTAVTLSGGFNWSPVRQLHLTADYWYYRYSDRIQTQSAQVLVSQEAARLAAGGMPGQNVRFSPAGELEYVGIKPINVDAPVTTSGIDFGAMVRLDGGVFGALPTDFEVSVGASGTYTLSYNLPFNEVSGPVALAGCDGMTPQSSCNLAGKRNANNGAPELPQIKANLPLVFRMGGHSVSAIGHYIGSLEDDVDATPGDMSRGQFTGMEIPALFTLDLQYSFSLNDVVGKEVAFKVGMLNATDQLPPLVNGLGTYAGESHDPRGRMFYGKVEGEF